MTRSTLSRAWEAVARWLRQLFTRSVSIGFTEEKRISHSLFSLLKR
jgi:hypothetical protein